MVERAASRAADRTIVVATGNPGKVAEIRAVLGPLGFGVRTLADVHPADAGPPLVEPKEVGTTFRENAVLKAVGYAEQVGSVVLADDSGLEVDALDGRPGVVSARYAAARGRAPAGFDELPRPERDRLNNALLLEELIGVPTKARTARFVCCIVVAAPGGRVLAEARGTFEGRIGEPPRVPAGENGFGYDPLFCVAPEFASTSAELSPDRKNALSHRGKAVRLICDSLANDLGQRSDQR